jgi:4-hydroxy-tetrahydrodipicolinate reductase
MTIRVLINGSYGKMGIEAVKAIGSSEEFMLVGQTGRKDNLTQVIANVKPQVVLDFTTAAAAFENSCKIIEAGVHPVIGTSGLRENDIQKLTQLCKQKKLGGLIIPNFSIGAVLAMQYAQNCALYFPDIEIIETHNPQKADSPSGTAIRTAEMIAMTQQTSAKETVSGVSQQQSSCVPLMTMEGARGAQYKDIPIHSIRLPGIVARQTVMFGGLGEMIHITHEVSNRAAYLPGILLACRKVIHLNTLLCGLEHIL